MLGYDQSYTSAKKITSMIITKVHPRMAAPGLEVMEFECCGAVPGTSIRIAAAQPCASGELASTGAKTSGFVS